MYKDKILAEVWRNRDAYVKKYHYDLDEIIEDLRCRQTRPHSEIVDRRGHRTSASSRHRGQRG